MPRRPAVRNHRRRAALVAFGAMFALALPSAASASEVHITPANNLFLTGAAGEDNDVDITENGANLILNDTEGLTAGAGCVPINVERASCPLAAFGNAYVFVDDGENKVEATTDHPIHIDGFSADSNNFRATGDGTTSLIGGSGPDVLRTSWSNDTLNGMGGNDNLESGSGDDELNGGSGDDVLTPGGGDDEINGGSDLDSVDYHTRLAPLQISIDNNKNDGAPGELDNVHTDVERVFGGSGSDEITGSPNRDLIQAGPGLDTVSGGGGDDEINGEDGNDELHGGAGVDFVSGGNDRDVVDGGSAGDLVVGGADDDEVNGAQGDDQLSGGAGNDHVDAGIGDDELQGNAGADNLVGGQGRDEISGGADDDTVDYSGNAAPLTVDLDGSTYDDGAENEGDTVLADVENVTGGTGNDKLTGNDQHNVLIGAQGNDSIDGGTNNDTLIGASGDDSIQSKDGVLDVVDCGIGNDTLDADPVDQLTDCELPVVTPGGGEGTGQPPVTPPVTPPITSPKLVIGAASRVSRSRVVKLSVSCPKSAGATCTGTLRLQRKVKGKVKTLGSKGFKVPAGAKRTLKIKVSKSTAKSVARKPLKVNAAAKSTAGASDTSRKVTLKPASRRKR
jgi:Ca2+-binding RTX toxin-like protein